MPKGEAARKAFGETIGADGRQLLTAIYDPTAPQELRDLPLVEILRRVWVHQYSTVEGHVCWRKAEDLPPAGTRCDSPYDPQARYGNKRTTTWTGYKVHITETCDSETPHLITHVETTPAHIGDVTVTETIHHSLASQALLPDTHIVDAGYVDAELLVQSKTEHQIRLLGPVRSDVNWQAQSEKGYDQSLFRIDWEQQTVTCPEGQTTHRWSPAQDHWGNSIINVRFTRKACDCCASRPLCTRAKTDPRELTLRPQAEHEALQTARQLQQTPAWKEQYNIRAGIEGTVSQRIRTKGLRQTRYLGLAKTHLQHILTAAAINIVRFDTWMSGKPRAKTRISHFEALRPKLAAAA